jgi:stalled ribosome rescue protein Dom34
MAHPYAVVKIDLHTAKIVHFDVKESKNERVTSISHDDRGRGTQPEAIETFFTEVCDELAGTKEILVTGPAVAASSFRAYMQTHRPRMAEHVVGWEDSAHVPDDKLLAFGERHFQKHDRAVRESQR